MPVDLHRRRFLARALAASAVLTGTVAAAAPLPAPRRDRRPVIVIGGGLAGLAVADHLMRAGESVLVLETRPVPGGRIRTLRAGFAAELRAEAGPTRIADLHHRCLALVATLGLPLEACEQHTAGTLFVHRGCRFGAAEACDRADPGLELAPGERGLTVAGLLERYVGTLPARLGTAESAATAAIRHALDAMRWPAWLADRGASPAAIRLMTLGAASQDLSALYVLTQIALHREARRYFRIAGGMDRLPAALAARLGTAVRYDTTVARIEHDRDGARVHAVDGHGEFALDAQALVLTLPPPVLRTLVFDPPLPTDKRLAIAAVPGYPVTRYALQTRTRSWRAAGQDGAARTDAPAEIVEASFGQPGTRGLLHVTAGDPAPDAAPTLARGIACAAEAFPDVRRDFETGTWVRWAQEPSARGAFAAFQPGQMNRAPALLARAQGRLHFAGEHTSVWTGWMEGALDSAARVCRELRT